MTIAEAVLILAIIILWGVTGLILLRSWLIDRSERRERWRDRQWPKQSRHTMKAHSELKAVAASQTKPRKLIARRRRKRSAPLQAA